MITHNSTETRIFLTDLQAYNEGSLVGRWITLPMDEMELHMAISEILTEGESVAGTEDHEEYFITDHEGFISEIDEYSNIFELNEMAQRIDELEEDQRTAVKLLLENYIVSDLDEAIERVDDMICTGESTMEDVAYSIIEECGMLDSMPDQLKFYFDYEAYGRDLEINGTYLEDDEGIIWECVA